MRANDIEKQWLREISTRVSMSKKRNIAVTYGKINDRKFNAVAISGDASRPGFIDTPENLGVRRNLKVLSVKYMRSSDSENKIFEALFRATTSY